MKVLRKLLPFVLCLAGAGLLWLAVPRLPHDSSLAQLFPTRGELRQRFEEFDRAFGTDDALLVMVEDHHRQPVFRPAFIRYLDRVTAALQADPGVEKVISLANMLDLAVLDPRLPPLPQPLLPSRRDRVTPALASTLGGQPLLAGLLSDDGTACACWVLLRKELRGSRDYGDRAAAIAARVPAPGPAMPDVQVVTTGFPLLHGALQAELWHDGMRLLLISLLAVVAVAVAGGTPVRAALGFVLSWPAVAGLLAAWCWVADRPIGVFGNTVLPLLLITSGASFVHFGRCLRTGVAVRPTLAACALSTATTAAAFGTLTLSGLPPLATLGELVAAGGVLALGLGTLCAYALAAPTPAAATPPPAPRRRSRFPVLALALPLALPWFAIEPSWPTAGNDVLSILPADHPVVRAAERAGRKLGALTSLEVVVALSPDSLQDPDLLLGLVEFDRALRGAGGDDIPFVLGPATLLRYLAAKRPGNDSGQVDRATAEYAIRHVIRPYLELARRRGGEHDGGLIAVLDDWMGQLVSHRGDQLRFGCRIPHLSPEGVRRVVRRLRREVFEPFERRLGAERIFATGYAVLVAEAAAEIEATERRSLLVGCAVLAALLLLVARAWRPWLLAVGVNAATLVGAANLLFWSHTALDLYSAVLAASVLGLLVDDTIHLLWFHQRAGPADGDPVDYALARAGPSIRLSSLALAAGFATFATSALPPYRHFAWLAVACTGLALFWDLAVLPRALRAWRS